MNPSTNLFAFALWFPYWPPQRQVYLADGKWKLKFTGTLGKWISFCCLLKLMLPVLLFFWKSNTKLFINGQFVESSTDKWIDIHNPVSTHNCLVLTHSWEPCQAEFFPPLSSLGQRKTTLNCSFELLFLLVTQGWAFNTQYLGKSIVGLSEENKYLVWSIRSFEKWNIW